MADESEPTVFIDQGYVIPHVAMRRRYGEIEKEFNRKNKLLKPNELGWCPVCMVKDFQGYGSCKENLDEYRTLEHVKDGKPIIDKRTQKTIECSREYKCKRGNCGVSISFDPILFVPKEPV